MAESSPINFPSQAVSDLEKLSYDYGEEVAKAIREEWFTGSVSKYDYNINSFHIPKHRLHVFGSFIYTKLILRITIYFKISLCHTINNYIYKLRYYWNGRPV